MQPQNGLLSGEDNAQMTIEVIQLYAQKGRFTIYSVKLKCKHLLNVNITTKTVAPDGLSLFLSLSL